MRYIDIPAKVISGNITNLAIEEFWPYNDGQGDRYWEGGSTPRPYRWVATMTVSEQRHSSHKTRKPYAYNGMDVKIGDFIVNMEGVAFKIISVRKKTDSQVVCVIEDELRYNTFRSGDGAGNGMFSVPTEIIVFETNSSGAPIVDPIPVGGVASSFYPNLSSRFTNLEVSNNFILNKINHGFEIGDLIAADPVNHTFVKSSSEYPYLVGRVSNTDLGPNAFMISPIQKIDDALEFLEGEVGQVLYADETRDGKLSTEGKVPYMMKLRNYSQSTVTGDVPAPTTTVGNAFKINGATVTVSGTGSTEDIINAINGSAESHGILADTTAASTRVTGAAASTALGEPAWYFTGTPMTATINGSLVEFTTTDEGMRQYGDTYGLAQDMVVDINAANIPNITATYVNGNVTLTNSTGGAIEIVNVVNDGLGNGFAGPSSASGIPLSTPASTESYIRLTAPDARAIWLNNVSGDVIGDCGLFSVENGIKAAGILIEQGIASTGTKYVATIAHRDALNAIIGEKAFVADKGNGEWGLYLYAGTGNGWIKIADADSAATDSNTVQVTCDVTDPESLSGVIHTVSGNSRVTSVVVSVEEEFDVPAYVIVGDAQNGSRLMAESQNDLMHSGDYQTNPSHVYVGEDDVDILFQVVAPEATVGIVTISITYA